MVLRTRKKKRYDRLQCQCMPSCKNEPLSNSPFCKEHQLYCPRRAPLNGEEPKFDPSRYNGKRHIQHAHNCFAYAFNLMDMPSKNECNENSCPVAFHQPGRTSGFPRWSNVKGKFCPDLLSRLKGDVPEIKLGSFQNKCPTGHRKIALVVDEDEDYHFYRQDSNTYWSHKPGGSKVTHLDATGRPIYDPALASRKYPGSNLDYDKFCGYLCIPSKKEFKFKRGGQRSKKRSTSKGSIKKRDNKKY